MCAPDELCVGVDAGNVFVGQISEGEISNAENYQV